MTEETNYRLGKSRFLNYVFAYPFILDGALRATEFMLPREYAETIGSTRQVCEDFYKVGLVGSFGLLLTSSLFFGPAIYRGLIDVLGEENDKKR